MIIKKGDSLYDTLFNKWKRDKPATVRHSGSVYEAVIDNDIINFALTGSDSPFGYYSENSMRGRG